MNQMQAFIEKARNDSGLMAKLDALGASGAGPDKIVALAATYGFTITEEDCRQAAEMAGMGKSGELAEEDLEAVAGGGHTAITENRYDPGECAKCKQVQYRCVGFLTMFHCDHYTLEQMRDGEYPTFWHKCAMGCFYYKAD